MLKRVGPAVAAMGLLATAAASATTRSPVGLQCTAVTTWACAEAKTCKRREGGKRGLKPALLAEQPEQRRICQMRKQALQTVRFLSPY